MSRGHGDYAYPRWYREDEEMFVDDQCCGNCIHQGEDCPFENYVGDDSAPRAKKKALREDAIVHDDELKWCIRWKMNRAFRF